MPALPLVPRLLSGSFPFDGRLTRILGSRRFFLGRPGPLLILTDALAVDAELAADLLFGELTDEVELGPPGPAPLDDLDLLNEGGSSKGRCAPPRRRSSPCAR